MRAHLNERKLKQPEVAQNCYRRIITEYSSSIYTSEARKALRILRDEYVDPEWSFFNNQRPENETDNDEWR
jgi:hypothetical protein